MELDQIIVLAVTGAIAGWLASLLMKGRGFGLLGNIVVGVFGSFVGEWLSQKLNFRMSAGEWVGPILTATAGAMLLLLLLALLRKR